MGTVKQEHITPVDQMMMLSFAKGLVPDAEIEGRAKRLLDTYCELPARHDMPQPAAPQPAVSKPSAPKAEDQLKIGDYLREKNVHITSAKQRLEFGRRLRGLYRDAYGHPPVTDKTKNNAAVYSIKDRPLFDEAFKQVYGMAVNDAG